MTDTIDPAAENEVMRRLRRKRSEVSAEIAETETLLMILRADLDALDGTLAIFDPACVKNRPRSRPGRARHDAYRGEMQQVVLRALADAPKPLTTIEVTDIVITERALDRHDRPLMRLMRGRTLSCLQNLREHHLVRSRSLAPKLMVWWLSSRTDAA